VVLGAEANIGAQAARSGLLIARSPDDPEHERILASSKSNLGPPLPALRYRIAPRTPDSAVPAVEWLGTCDYTAATLLAQGDGASGEPGSGSGRTSAVDEAAAWLRAQLAAGPRPPPSCWQSHAWRASAEVVVPHGDGDSRTSTISNASGQDAASAPLC